MVPMTPARRLAARSSLASSGRVLALRAELWRRHALLPLVAPTDPVYEVAATEILELTEEFLGAVTEERRPRSGALWRFRTPRPRTAQDNEGPRQVRR